MKFYCEVLIQGVATAEIEANSIEEAKEKMVQLNHDDFRIDYAALDYDDSLKYRELYDEDGNQVR